jgi:plastocyanin
MSTAPRAAKPDEAHRPTRLTGHATSLLGLLRAALTVQVLLGLARFLAPYVGMGIDQRIWLVHPVLGIAIASSALWLFRGRTDVPATSARTTARFIALAPLVLGLANMLGLAAGLGLVLLHMALGLAAIKVIDVAVEQQRASQRSVTLTGSSAGDPVVGSDAITVHNDAFDPPVVQITPGTTVTWTFNDGGRAHNVIADGWSSEVLASGSYQHTFAEPGSYAYRCTLHMGMDGRVDVGTTR